MKLHSCAFHSHQIINTFVTFVSQNSNMYKVIIEGQEILVGQEDIDSLDVSFDKKNGLYHILRNGKSYRLNPLSATDNGKSQVLEINDLNIQTEILNPLDQQIESMGLTILEETKSKDIKAPMPGLILDIMCQEGEEIEEGKSLLILEAMKMENVIKAEGSGTIQKINKTKGETVEKGELIIEII